MKQDVFEIAEQITNLETESNFCKQEYISLGERLANIIIKNSKEKTISNHIIHEDQMYIVGLAKTFLRVKERNNVNSVEYNLIHFIQEMKSSVL